MKNKPDQQIDKLCDKMDDLRTYIEQKLDECKKEILDALNKIHKELKAMRQEQTMHQGVHDRVEERLNNVEEKVGIVPQ